MEVVCGFGEVECYQQGGWEPAASSSLRISHMSS